jgi:FAD/FMN-containing dehydrogenase
MGKHGLACDNVVSMDIVTANGQLIQVSEQENADLFWGLRGGGGNFGIVTSFEYRLHELGPIFGGGVLYPVDQAREVLRFYRDFALSTPDELGTQLGRVCTLDDGVPVIGVAGCYSGSLQDGEKALAPLRRFGSPIADLFGPISYLQMQTMFDPWAPPGRHAYWKSNFLSGLPEAAIETFHHYALTAPSRYTNGPWLETVHGAASRIDPASTAYPHRRQAFNFSVFSSWSDATETSRNVAWTRECWDAMRPFMVPGAYANYLEDEADPHARAAYGGNHDRLVELKNKYDPDNVFRINHNIRPTA